jgi:isoquinoline 1-oxidoreductase
MSERVGDRVPGTDPIEPERYELSEDAAYLFHLERRQFLQVAGGSLIVAALHGRAAGQGRRGEPGGTGDDEVAAWLQVAADGDVTVFTGKVEVGQNIRTSLAQTVADELCVPFERITMVMGDTARTPFDNGTFGSQSTPRMAPQLARASRAARSMLLARAAERWQLDAAALTADGGRVMAPDGRTVGFGELVRDQQLRGAVSAAASALPRGEWRERGTSRPKAGARAFVTGAHRFTTDIVRPGMLYGRVVRPDRYGATISEVDLSAARRIEGATVVHDGAFIGVAAPSPRAAARAADAVRVTWRVDDRQPSSETLYDVLRGGGAIDGQAAAGPSPHLVGDLATRQRLATRTFTRTFRIPYIAHVPLEPRAAVAEWQDDGGLTVWTGTQRPFGVRRELAQAFRLAEEQVRVVMTDTGSGYGGKHTGEQAIEAARLARAARRPVSLVWTRAEEFMWAYFRPAGVIDASAGVDGEGRLVRWTFDNWNSGTAGIRTPYDVPHQAIAFHPAASPLRQGSYRALAATANTYAREMLMDEIARALGEDLLAYRLRHLSEPRMRGVLQAVADHVGWPAAVGRERAWGLACGTEKSSVVATAAEVSREGNGFRVERLVTAFECGALVNPEGVRHQVEGAVVQGLGGALFEAMRFADGRLQNGSLAQYRVPRFADMPVIEVLLLDRPGQASEGAGETPIIAVAPAIGSAARAFGVVDDALPVRLIR